MKKFLTLLPVHILVLAAFLTAALLLSKSVTVIAETAPIENRTCVIIDAGHGGVDGGATSCTGVLESQLNLEIALRLNDLMHLLGMDTLMIRTTDVSIHTQGQTIAAKKVSDLKQRVNIVNDTENAVLISLHMNHFPDSRYHGAQVFYAQTENSQELAKAMQSALNQSLDPTGTRQIKKADGIYLMQHIQQPGILIECGFLSNHAEEAKLRDPEYQKKLCAVICTSMSSFLPNT